MFFFLVLKFQADHGIIYVLYRYNLYHRSLFQFNWSFWCSKCFKVCISIFEISNWSWHHLCRIKIQCESQIIIPIWNFKANHSDVLNASMFFSSFEISSRSWHHLCPIQIQFVSLYYLNASKVFFVSFEISNSSWHHFHFTRIKIQIVWHIIITLKLQNQSFWCPKYFNALVSSFEISSRSWHHLCRINVHIVWHYYSFLKFQSHD